MTGVVILLDGACAVTNMWITQSAHAIETHRIGKYIGLQKHRISFCGAFG